MRRDRSAHDGLGRRRDHREARAIDGLTASDMVLHHHHADQYHGSGHATEEKSENSETATVRHYPLPRGPPDCSVASALTFVQDFRLIFAKCDLSTCRQTGWTEIRSVRGLCWSAAAPSRTGEPRYGLSFCCV